MFRQNQRTTIYQSGPVSFDEATFEAPDGRMFKRVFLSFGGDSVLVIPRDVRGNYILVKQLRAGLPHPTLEFPSGGVLPEESVTNAAERELREELGLAGTFRPIGRFTPMAGVVDMSVSVILCQGATSVSPRDLEAHESIEPIVLTEQQVQASIKNGELTDGFALAALSLVNVVANA